MKVHRNFNPSALFFITVHPPTTRATRAGARFMLNFFTMHLHDAFTGNTGDDKTLCISRDKNVMIILLTHISRAPRARDGYIQTERVFLKLDTIMLQR